MSEITEKEAKKHGLTIFTPDYKQDELPVRYPTGRKCGSCGTPLSEYNPILLCNSCKLSTVDTEGIN